MARKAKGEGGNDMVSVVPLKKDIYKKLCFKKVEGFGAEGQRSFQHYVSGTKDCLSEGHGSYPVFNSSQGTDCRGETSREADSFYRGMAEKRYGRRTGLARYSSLVVFPSFYRPERRVQMEANNRSLKIEQKDKEEKLQNGRPKDSVQPGTTRSLGGQARPQGRLLPCSSSTGNVEVLCVCHKDKRLPKDILLQGPTLWPHNSPLGLHKSDKAYQSGAEGIGYTDNLLLGRLSYPGKIQTGSFRSYKYSDRCPSEVRLPHKLGEVIDRTPKGSRVLRREFRFDEPNLLSSSGESKESSGNRCKISEGLSSLKTGTRENSRFSELCRSVPESRKAVSEANPSLDREVHFGLEQRPTRCSERRVKGKFYSLGRSRLSNVSNPHEKGSLQLISDDRCIRGCVGRNPSGPSSEVPLAKGMDSKFHKLEGTESYTPLLSSISRKTEGSGSQGAVRQYDSSGMSEETRFLSVQGTLDSVQRPVTVCRGPGDHPGTSSSGGALKCAGRSSIEEQVDFHRVEARSPVLREMLFSPRSSSGRLVRNDREHQTASIRVTLPRSESRGLGRSEPGLESLEFHLPFSSVPAARGNYGTLKELPRGRFPDCSSLANGQLVYRSGGEVCNQISSSSRAFSLSGEGRENVFSQAPLYFPASRVDLIKEAVRKKGLSEGAANILS